MKRLGIRKVLAKIGETKLGKVVDTVVSTPVVKIEGVLNSVAEKSGLNKVKIDVSGNRGRKNANSSILAKIEQAEKNSVEQEARNIVSAKEFEIEKENDGPIEVKGISLRDMPREGLCVAVKSDVLIIPKIKAGERV